jgi:hypothetical protein
MSTAVATERTPAASSAVEPRILRPTRPIYVAFAVLSMLPFILGLMPQVLGRPIVIELVVIGAVVAFLSLVWIRSFRLELTPTELRYRSLFGGSRKVALADIERAEIEIGARTPRDRFRPQCRLVVVGRGEPRPIVVNLKVFPFEPLKDVCAAVGATLAPGAA